MAVEIARGLGGLQTEVAARLAYEELIRFVPTDSFETVADAMVAAGFAEIRCDVIGQTPRLNDIA